MTLIFFLILYFVSCGGFSIFYSSKIVLDVLPNSSVDQDAKAEPTSSNIIDNSVSINHVPHEISHIKTGAESNTERVNNRLFDRVKSQNDVEVGRKYS